MKIPTKHFISIVQSSNRVLLSSQFEPNLSFQGHVGESAHQYSLLILPASRPFLDVITQLRSFQPRLFC